APISASRESIAARTARRWIRSTSIISSWRTRSRKSYLRRRRNDPLEHGRAACVAAGSGHARQALRRSLRTEKTGVRRGRPADDAGGARPRIVPEPAWRRGLGGKGVRGDRAAG